MHTCLVTGGSGFIGSHLVDGLLARGDAVRVLDDFSTGNRNNLAPVEDRIELFDGSVTDAALVADAANGVDVVYHLAALPSVVKSVDNPVATHDICVTGTLNVLEAARHQKVRRVVYAGSSSAYGDAPGEIRREEDALIALSPYAAAKLAGEHYCQSFTKSFGLETVRLRFFNVFGPRQDASSPYSGVIALFIAAMSQGERPTIYGDGLQTRDFIYVENVVQAMIQSAEAPTAVGNVYNIGTGQRITLLDLVQTLNDVLGTNLEPKHGPARAGDVRYSQADVSKAQADLAFAPEISFAEGLRRTIAAQSEPSKTAPS